MRGFFFFFGSIKSGGQQVLMEFVDWKKNWSDSPYTTRNGSGSLSESSISDVL